GGGRVQPPARPGPSGETPGAARSGFAAASDTRRLRPLPSSAQSADPPPCQAHSWTKGPPAVPAAPEDRGAPVAPTDASRRPRLRAALPSVRTKAAGRAAPGARPSHRQPPAIAPTRSPLAEASSATEEHPLALPRTRWHGLEGPSVSRPGPTRP